MYTVSKHIILLLICMSCIQLKLSAQNETQLIKETLLDYIEGTANGEPDRVKRAFHKDLNLYGSNYTNNIKQGSKSNRIGKIVSIDYENDAAIAKIEIDMPNRKRLYTDYLMLLKVSGHWKIIHKSFTYRNY